MKAWLSTLPTPSTSSSQSVKALASEDGKSKTLGAGEELPADWAAPHDATDLDPHHNRGPDPQAIDTASKTENILVIPNRRLNTGAICPGIGYGTGGEGKATANELYHAVRVALDRGYRSFDVAPFYLDGEVEATLGRAIRESAVPRSEIFITTKVWPTFSRRPEAWLDMSLKNLGMDYVDCLLLHWPVPLVPVEEDPYAMGTHWDSSWDFKKTWIKMQEISTDKTRAIGVCNFTVNRLRLLLAAPTTSVVPAVLQVEGHPELPQRRLMQFCRKQGIQVFCFSPLAQGQVSNPVIRHVAKHYNIDTGRAALSWAVQRGTVPLPKSTNVNRIWTNMSLVYLDDDAVDLLDKLGKHPRRIVNPRLFFGHDIFENNIDSLDEEPKPGSAQSESAQTESQSSSQVISQPEGHTPSKRRR